MKNEDDDDDDVDAATQLLNTNHIIRSKLRILHDGILLTAATNSAAVVVTRADLYKAYKRSTESVDRMNHSTSSMPSLSSQSQQHHRHSIHFVSILALIVISILFAIIIIQPSLSYVLGTRCFIPNNYLIWEATRPVSNCQYCKNIDRPLILPNMTRNEFLPFAYSLQPIIIKNAVVHWTARTQLNYTLLRDLYQRNREDLQNFQDECQFLNFKSNFLTLEEFFDMSDERANSGQPPWYVGFSNCQPAIISELRRLYPIPHFLPADAEIPNTDYIFLGYDQGATMHLDYIPRLMWQAQLRGNKSWNLAPTPECENVCGKFSFYVEPGDAVLLDTRVWYHGTNVLNGEFSLTIQSEYG